jgi:hypothetical protein
MIGSGCNGEVNVSHGDTYSTTANKSTSALWVDVGNTSPGTESTLAIFDGPRCLVRFDQNGSLQQ